MGFTGGSVIKNPPANAGDVGLSPDSGRSPRAGNDNPLQCFCLENAMDRGAWWATVHRITKSRTQLSNQQQLYLGLILSWYSENVHRWKGEEKKKEGREEGKNGRRVIFLSRTEWTCCHSHVPSGLELAVDVSLFSLSTRLGFL